MSLQSVNIYRRIIQLECLVIEYFLIFFFKFLQIVLYMWYRIVIEPAGIEKKQRHTFVLVMFFARYIVLGHHEWLYAIPASGQTV